MIKVQVKTLWLGRVGLRSRYIDEAQATKQDIVVLHEHLGLWAGLTKRKSVIADKHLTCISWQITHINIDIHENPCS